ncbi:9380_t:CDS:1, partial [Funneliformis caledonium]
PMIEVEAFRFQMENNSYEKRYRYSIHISKFLTDICDHLAIPDEI